MVDHKTNPYSNITNDEKDEVYFSFFILKRVSFKWPGNFVVIVSRKFLLKYKNYMSEQKILVQ